MLFLIYAVFTRLLLSEAVLQPVNWNATEYLSDQFDYNGHRFYHVLFPAGYPSRSPYPAILLFHGNGGDASAFYYETRMANQACMAGYVVAYAEGVPTTNSSKRCRERSWNGGSCCDEAFEKSVDDVAYTVAVIESLTRRFHVNKHLIFLSGVSEGASMVYRVGCQHPNLIAGLAPVVGSLEMRNGSMCGGACQEPGDGYKYCTWNQTALGCSAADWKQTLPRIYDCDSIVSNQVPILMFNGLLDPAVNTSGAVILPTNTAGYIETYSPISFVSEHFRKSYGCTDDSLMLSFNNGTGRNTTRCYTWANCTNVTFCLSDAGHKWFGDTYDVFAVCTWEGYSSSSCSAESDLASYGPQTQSIKATDQIIHFFNHVQLSEPRRSSEERSASSENLVHSFSKFKFFV